MEQKVLAKSVAELSEIEVAIIIQSLEDREREQWKCVKKCLGELVYRYETAIQNIPFFQLLPNLYLKYKLHMCP